jgi:3-mercaptopyruvate sulfurtransferase SseA
MTKTFSGMILLLIIILAGCNSAQTSVSNVSQKQPPSTNQIETTYADGVRRITIRDLEELRRKGNVFIVDVRNQAAYDQGHIPGAKLIPVGEVPNRINEFPRDKPIVTYCS